MLIFQFSEGKNTILKQAVSFAAGQSTATVTVFLPADKIGLHLFKANVTAGVKEKQL